MFFLELLYWGFFTVFLVLFDYFLMDFLTDFLTDLMTVFMIGVFIYFLTILTPLKAILTIGSTLRAPL